jgi:hypothetical protein
MRVSVYCSSAKDIPQHSLDLAFEVGVAIGKARSNNVQSVTGNTVNLVTGTAYVLDVIVNAAATLATFKVYNAITEALIWTNTINSNIPPLNTARQTGVSAAAFRRTAVAATLGNLYMMGHGTPKGYLKAKGRMR